MQSRHCRWLQREGKLETLLHASDLIWAAEDGGPRGRSVQENICYPCSHAARSAVTVRATQPMVTVQVDTEFHVDT
jgi:hypothetical protein